MGSNGITELMSECNYWDSLKMHSILVGEVNLHNMEVASKPARSQLSQY